MNGHGRDAPYGGGRAPSPRRDGGGGGYRGEYEPRPRYW